MSSLSMPTAMTMTVPLLQMTDQLLMTMMTIMVKTIPPPTSPKSMTKSPLTTMTPDDGDLAGVPAPNPDRVEIAGVDNAQQPEPGHNDDDYAADANDNIDDEVSYANDAGNQEGEMQMDLEQQMDTQYGLQTGEYNLRAQSQRTMGISTRHSSIPP
jgi:hypothetical protein